MVKTVGPRLIIALMCFGTAAAVCAHPFLTPVSDTGPHHGYRAEPPSGELLFALPQSDETPKLWPEMTAKERAEIRPS